MLRDLAYTISIYKFALKHGYKHLLRRKPKDCILSG